MSVPSQDKSVIHEKLPCPNPLPQIRSRFGAFVCGFNFKRPRKSLTRNRLNNRSLAEVKEFIADGRTSCTVLMCRNLGNRQEIRDSRPWEHILILSADEGSRIDKSDAKGAWEAVRRVVFEVRCSETDGSNEAGTPLYHVMNPAFAIPLFVDNPSATYIL